MCKREGLGGEGEKEIGDFSHDIKACLFPFCVHNIRNNLSKVQKWDCI